jgi:hypothetical protein
VHSEKMGRCFVSDIKEEANKMVPSTWINIYDTLKNGEIDSIDLNSYQNNIYPLNNNIITFQINAAMRAKLKAEVDIP